MKFGVEFDRKHARISHVKYLCQAGWLKVLTCAQEVINLNLCWDTGYPERNFCGFHQSMQMLG